MRISALLPAGLVLALAASLAACGFHPMYMPSANGGPAIGPVIIDKVDGKAGYVLKAELEKLLDVERGAGPVRRLKVSLSEIVGGLGFRVDESASRSDLFLDGAYTLYDIDGNVVLSGRIRSTASYDVPSSAYGEIAAQDDARERAAEALAERIRGDLAVRLALKRAGGLSPEERRIENERKRDEERRAQRAAQSPPNAAPPAPPTTP